MRAALLLVMLLLSALLPGGRACAQAIDETVDSLDLSGWQAALSEAGAGLDVSETIQLLSKGEFKVSYEKILEQLRQLALGEAGGMGAQLTAFIAPALLWAVNRLLTDQERLGKAAGYVCCLSGICVMLGVLGAHMELARTTVRRIGSLTGQVFPVLTALMSASGSPGAAGAVQPLAVLAGGAMTTLVERIMTVLGGGAAVLAAAGSLTERISLKGLFRLCISTGGWLLGAVMTAFLGLTSLGGAMGSAQDGVTVKAAKYAVDNLLPVVGGEVADAMDSMIASASLVRSAAGVTGVIVMLAVCIRPVISLALGMLALRLSSALTEPVADGPLNRCMEQLGQAARLMLAAVAVSAALFITLTGMCIGAR